MPVREDGPVDITLENEKVENKVATRTLNPKSKEWAGVYRDAKVAMGNMEPSMPPQLDRLHRRTN